MPLQLAAVFNENDEKNNILAPCVAMQNLTFFMNITLKKRYFILDSSNFAFGVV